MAAPSALPVSDKPVMLNFSKGPTKTHTGERESFSLVQLLMKPSVAGSVKPLSLGFSTEDVSNEQGDTEDPDAHKGKFHHSLPIISLNCLLIFSGFLEASASFDCQQEGNVYDKNHH
jgi:hypothetical protein